MGSTAISRRTVLQGRWIRTPQGPSFVIDTTQEVTEESSLFQDFRVKEMLVPLFDIAQFNQDITLLHSAALPNESTRFELPRLPLHMLLGNNPKDAKEEKKE